MKNNIKIVLLMLTLSGGTALTSDPKNTGKISEKPTLTSEQRAINTIVWRLWNYAQKRAQDKQKNTSPEENLKSIMEHFTGFLASKEELKNIERQSFFSQQLQACKKNMRKFEPIINTYVQAFRDLEDLVYKQESLYKQLSLDKKQLYTNALSSLKAFLVRGETLEIDDPTDTNYLLEIKPHVFFVDSQAPIQAPHATKITSAYIKNFINEEEAEKSSYWSTSSKLFLAGVILTIGAYSLGYKPHQTAFNWYNSLLPLLSGVKTSAATTLQAGMNITQTLNTTGSNITRVQQVALHRR